MFTNTTNVKFRVVCLFTAPFFVRCNSRRSDCLRRT